MKALIIVIFSIIIACLFGAIHNQLSYSVSYEFFEHFLFGNFGTNEWNLNNKRIEASVVGILGSYWVGFILGIIYAVICLFINTENKFKYILKAISINIFFALIGSIIGYIIGFIIPWENLGIWMEFGTQNPQKYVQANFMHSGSYYGGIIGLIIGIIYLFKNKS
ncbi:hypothetical protein EG240_15745 [Paenimyroides tangerinum]|uniref:Signal peptide-containing protein n=1 Tax=Paenimyroides tangerinum TaxID=2488728 RepID=A0A3P3VVS3_9FLAO|nr:hypothetical protein [Paenimyroides tangerinum]RRJ86905.1 hypothetical protein EG240_15745 [Paenimyroides tangerinum]